MCFDFTYRFYLKHFSFLEEFIHVCRSPSKESVTFFSQVLFRFEFWREIFRKKLLISNFVWIRPEAAELFQADGRTDRRDEANTRFSKFTDAHKILYEVLICCKHTSILFCIYFCLNVSLDYANFELYEVFSTTFLAKNANALCKGVLNYYHYLCTVHFVESFNQHTNWRTYIKFFILKHLKSQQHVSILRSSSGNYTVLC